jgi:hypothetical protein
MQKIETVAKIKKAVLKDNGVDIYFAELGISDEQVKAVNKIIRGKSLVKISIELSQEELPGFDEDNQQQEPPIGEEQPSEPTKGRKKKTGKDAAAG